MTVGRFLRGLGYQGLDGFKVHQCETAPPIAAQMNLTTVEQLRLEATGGRPLAALMAEQLDMLNHIYDLSAKPQWSDAVAAILGASKVFIAAHQTDLLGRFFCDRSVFARDNVQLAGNDSANYAELLCSPATGSLLVIINSRRFVKSRPLARLAKQSGLKIVLVTSQYTEWAHEFANLTLSVPPPQVGQPANLIAMSALLEFLAMSVKHAAGHEGDTWTLRLEELENMFAESPKR